MRILIMCASGCSSSVLMAAMDKAAAEMGLEDVTVECINSNLATTSRLNYDAVLLAPQVRFQKAKMEKIMGPDVPVGVLDTLTYGRLNGKACIEKVLAMLEEKKAEKAA